MQSKKPHLSIFHYSFLIIIVLGLTGCQALLPARSVPIENQAPLYKAPAFQEVVQLLTTPTPGAQSASTQTASCIDMLAYVPPDLTYPDLSDVKTGEVMDKRWQVKNSGTCNWGDGYTLQMVDGESMSATSPQALVPARNGTEAVISVIFVAPDEPGRYVSRWQAVNPDGQPFGEILYIDIYVVK